MNMATKSIQVNFNWKTYRVDLDALTGEPVCYAVQVSARGKSVTERRLWEKRFGAEMPQRLKDVMNVRGVSTSIAYVMGW